MILSDFKVKWNFFNLGLKKSSLFKERELKKILLSNTNCFLQKRRIC